MIVVLMGVCGSGKTTIGRVLSESLRWPFFDADTFHPPENVRKMAAGEALTDADRWPWLERIANELRSVLARGEHAVLACSALKQTYRDRLAGAGDARFVFLEGDYATIAQRLSTRSHEYMPATLLASQFAALEPPVDALVVDIRASVQAQVDFICEAFALAKATRA
jgi:gluconokinase